MGQICSKGTVVEGEQAPVQEEKPVLVQEAEADAVGQEEQASVAENVPVAVEASIPEHASEQQEAEETPVSAEAPVLSTVGKLKFYCIV